MCDLRGWIWLIPVNKLRALMLYLLPSWIFNELRIAYDPTSSRPLTSCKCDGHRICVREQRHLLIGARGYNEDCF